MYTEAFLTDLERGLANNLGAWGLSADTQVTLLNISENATFRADDPVADAPVILRVHRPHYHTRDEILSELAWIDALRTEAIAPIPAPLALQAGGHIAAIDTAQGTRDVVAFEYMSGSEPAPGDDLTDGFHQLGAISGKLHDHARGWTQPADFVRKSWTFDTTVGRTPHWGGWRDALGLTDDGRTVLERTCTVLERRLHAFGTGPDRFGLIHADLRLANLLVDGDRIGLIDFDDCGFGWFAFDFAAAISFYETDPSIPALQDAWCAGYRSVADLDPEVEAELSTFIMLRRLQLTAWIASHAETPTAQEMGSAFTDDTVAIAERYLSERG
ncbi:MAG: phosphotransferase enzyme family protein [Geminicoccaceae bacterium]